MPTRPFDKLPVPMQICLKKKIHFLCNKQHYKDLMLLVCIPILYKLKNV